MGKKHKAMMALVLGGVTGGIGGGLLGYSKGHNDGYAKAKSEDMPYIHALEDENAKLHSRHEQLLAELAAEKRNKAQLPEKVQTKTVTAK